MGEQSPTLSPSDAVAAHLERRSHPRYEPVDLVHPTVAAADITDPAAASKPGESIGSLIRRANHDEITGLPNRTWFIREVDRVRFEAAVASPSALFLIDLDGFKAINDTWGHGAGDTVLAEIGNRLANLFPSIALSARFGGDEFAMWVPDCNENQACLVAERVLANLSEPIPGELMLSVGASIGWVITEDSAPMHALLSRADIAMYAIKETGGHGHRMFDRVLASQRVEGRVLQREIRQGLATGQFELARQAIVTPAGEQVGFEGLARWRHPRRGLLCPAEFLSAVESGGNAEEFDHYMLDLAMEALRSEPELTEVWVNLTGESLNESLVERLTELKESIDPTKVVFEISERASAESPRAVAAIAEIAELGYGVAIDDFGSGFSRLGAMATLPISYVKIDRQFTANVAKDASAKRLCAAIIDLIHAIGAEVVAEGIETAAQARTIAELGCEYLQGFFFDMPAVDGEAA